MNNVVEKATSEVAKRLGIPEETAKRIYWDYWKYIRQRVKEDMPNFNVPYIGKIYINNKRKNAKTEKDNSSV